MKLIYGDDRISKNIKELGSELGTIIEKRDSLEESFKKFSQQNKGKEVGGPVPQTFIELTNHLFSLQFYVDLFVGQVVITLIERLVKKIPELVKKTNKQYETFLLIYGESEIDSENNIYYFIPTNLSQTELENALNKAFEISNILNDLRSRTNIIGSFRFQYTSKGFVLYELKKSEF